jgi:hypothetical protein
MRKLLLFILLAPVWASATVADSSATGFTVKITLNLKAAPADAYKKILRVGDWWDSAHTFSGDAHNLSIEEKAGGCWCEKLPNGGSIKHMEVITLMPGARIVFSGTLGPLQNVAAAGAMIFAITKDGDGSKLTFSYSVAGYLPAGMNTYAAPVDGVLTEALNRFKDYAELSSR